MRYVGWILTFLVLAAAVVWGAMKFLAKKTAETAGAKTTGDPAGTLGVGEPGTMPTETPIKAAAPSRTGLGIFARIRLPGALPGTAGAASAARPASEKPTVKAVIGDYFEQLARRTLDDVVADASKELNA